jgi:hypothetical protein
MTRLGKKGKGKVGKTDDAATRSVSKGLAKTLIEGQCDAEQREKLSSPKDGSLGLSGTCTLCGYPNVSPCSAVSGPVPGVSLTDKTWGLASLKLQVASKAPGSRQGGDAGPPPVALRGTVGRQLVKCCVMLLPSSTCIVNTEHEASLT